MLLLFLKSHKNKKKWATIQVNWSQKKKKQSRGRGFVVLFELKGVTPLMRQRGTATSGKDLAINHGRNRPEEKTTGHTQSFHLAALVFIERKRIE